MVTPTDPHTERERIAERLEARADEKERVSAIANRYWRAHQARQYVQEHLITDRSDYAQTCSDVRLAREAAAELRELRAIRERAAGVERGGCTACLCARHGTARELARTILHGDVPREGEE